MDTGNHKMTETMNEQGSKITWKKGLFQCAYRLFSGNRQIGKLKPGLVHLSAKAEVEDRSYRFHISEWKQRGQVVDLLTNKVVATIRFSHWLPKATIEYQGQRYTWSLSNLWETRWKLVGDTGAVYRYKGWSCKGQVEGSIPINLLSVVGLFISHYYWQLSVIIAAALIPLFIAS